MKNRIAMLRKEQGLNQKELGLKLDVGQTTVSAWETGKNEPDMTALQQLSQLFDVSIGYLMGVDSERWPGGLKNPEYQARIQQRIADERRERDILEWQRNAETEARGGITDEDIEMAKIQVMWDEWDELAKVVDDPPYFEAFRINKMFEQLTKPQREKAVELIRIAFFD